MQLKVYAVLAGEHYHGEDSDTLKLFVDKKDALAYGKQLEKENDYFELVEQSIELPE